LAALPEQRQKIEALKSSVRRLEEEVSVGLKRTRLSGADATAVATQLEETRRKLADAAKASQSDYARALTVFQAAADDLEKERGELQAIDAQHQFATRTLPLTIGASILGVIVLSGGGLRLFHSYRQRSVQKQLKTFKGQVVELSDLLDAL